MDNSYKYIKCISSGAFSMCGLYKKNNKYYAIKTSIDSGEYDGISCNELREREAREEYAGSIYP